MHPCFFNVNAVRHHKGVVDGHKVRHKHAMFVWPARRFIFPATAAAVVLLLAVWQLLPHHAAPPSTALNFGINDIDWTGRSLTLSGRTAPNNSITVSVGETESVATADAAGSFAATLTVEQKSPTRAYLKTQSGTWALLLVKLQGRWQVLQRSDAETSDTNIYGWVPTTTINTDDRINPAILTLGRDTRGYAAAFSMPTGHIAYVYGDSRLTGIVKNPLENTLAFASVSATASQLRVDIFNGDQQLTHRLRMTLPPADTTARYSLSDGDVWVFTDYDSQKAETDETFPGQFLPDVGDDKTSGGPAVAATPQDKAAPSAQSAPTR